MITEKELNDLKNLQTAVSLLPLPEQSQIYDTCDKLTDLIKLGSVGNKPGYGLTALSLLLGHGAAGEPYQRPAHTHLPKAIVINGVKTTTGKAELTYEDIAEITGHKPGSVVTVSWRDRQGNGSGLLNRGQSVKTVDGLIINACITGNA